MIRNPITDWLIWRDLTAQVQAYHVQHQPAPNELFNAQFEAFTHVQQDLLAMILFGISTVISLCVWRFVRREP